MTSEELYFDPESGRDIPRVELAALPEDEQKRIAKHWFRQHYEDPVENTPYESAEGGYIYIWGGPHRAEDVLYSEFSGALPNECIEEIANELETDHDVIEWASIPGPEDFDTSVFASEFFPRFEESISRIRRLASYELKDADQNPFIALLYANVITSLEAYLSDVFISLVVRHPSLLRKFVESDPLFKSQRTATSELFNLMDSIEARVRSQLYVLPFHRLEKVQKMYDQALGIKFPSGLKEILNAVQVRHDIIHRNGARKDGTQVILSTSALDNLLAKVEAFVESLDRDVRDLVRKLTTPATPILPT